MKRGNIEVDLSSLPKKEREMLAFLKEKMLTDFRFFRNFMWQEVNKTPYIEFDHLELMTDFLLLLDAGIITNLVVNIAPRMRKTELVRLFMAWRYSKNHKAKIINVSTVDDLAMQTSQRVKDYLENGIFKMCFPELKIRKETYGKSLWELDTLGAMTSRSLLSAIIGHGANSAGMLYIDDPITIKKGEDISPIEVEGVNNLLLNSTLTRRDDINVPVLMTMQRLSVNDPTATFIDEKILKESEIQYTESGLGFYSYLPKEPENEWAWLAIPTLQDGKSICEKIHTTSFLSNIRKRYPIKFNAQYQQMPQVLQGGLFDPDWFVIYDEDRFGSAIKGLPAMFFADTSDTELKKNDPSGIISAFSDGRNVYISNYDEFWAEFNKRINNIINFCNSNGYTSRSILQIEPKSSGRSIIQNLKSTSGVNVKEFVFSKKISQNDPKTVRAKAIISFVESQKIVLRKGAFTKSFIENVCLFPNILHDERIDCLIMAVDYFLNRQNKGF